LQHYSVIEAAFVVAGLYHSLKYITHSVDSSLQLNDFGFVYV